MTEVLEPIAPVQTECKCCGASAPTLLDWWYVAPRNGHVSIHSRDSLLRLVEPLGYTHGSSNESLHVLFKQLPSFASHLISKAA